MEAQSIDAINHASALRCYVLLAPQSWIYKFLVRWIDYSHYYRTDGKLGNPTSVYHVVTEEHLTLCPALGLVQNNHWHWPSYIPSTKQEYCSSYYVQKHKDSRSVQCI